MSHWSVMVQATTPAPLTEDQAEALATALGDASAVAMRHNPPEVHARFDVQAGTIRAAVANGITAFVQAMDSPGVTYTLDTVEATTYEALDRELAQPQVPQLAGAAEIADMLGVSRQRAHQVADRDDFPPPVQELASGKVWVRAAVDRFVAGWPRRSGHPRSNDEEHLRAAIRAVLDHATLSAAVRYQFERSLRGRGGRYLSGKAHLLHHLPQHQVVEVASALEGDARDMFLAHIARASELAA